MRTNHANLRTAILARPKSNLSRTPQWSIEGSKRCQNLFHQCGIDGECCCRLLISVFHSAGVDTTVGTGGGAGRTTRSPATPRPSIRTRTSGRSLPLAPPRLRSRGQCHRTINRPKPTFTTRTLILRLCPLVDTIEAELVSASADGCDFRHGRRGIEADGAGEVLWWFLSIARGRSGSDCHPSQRFGSGFQIHLVNFFIVEYDGCFFRATCCSWCIPPYHRRG
mmetsp:Transcript_33207/g.69885  ORF Transcript_33207/g.69885 Transcript_33207/m.69885 type:complete len:223 (+) Transcript_33207:1060-1728(+)